MEYGLHGRGNRAAPAKGKTVNEEDIARLSPARYEHINPYGKYHFEVEEGLSRTRLQPLRPPSEHQSG